MNELKILLINLDNELVIYVEQLINYANRVQFSVQIPCESE